MIKGHQLRTFLERKSPVKTKSAITSWMWEENLSISILSNTAVQFGQLRELLTGPLGWSLWPCSSTVQTYEISAHI